MDKVRNPKRILAKLLSWSKWTCQLKSSMFFLNDIVEYLNRNYFQTNCSKWDLNSYFDAKSIVIVFGTDEQNTRPYVSNNIQYSSKSEQKFINLCIVRHSKKCLLKILVYSIQIHTSKYFHFFWSLTNLFCFIFEEDKSGSSKNATDDICFWFPFFGIIYTFPRLSLSLSPLLLCRPFFSFDLLRFVYHFYWCVVVHSTSKST